MTLPPRFTRSARWVPVALAVLFSVLLVRRAMVISSRIKEAPLTFFSPYSSDVDESCWLSSTYFYDLFFVKHDFVNEDWFRVISYDQPPVGKYILGASLHLFRNKLVEDNAGLEYWFRTMLGKHHLQALSRLYERTQLPSDHEMLTYVSSIVYSMKTTEEPRTLDEPDYYEGRRTVMVFAFLSMVLLAGVTSFNVRHLFPALLASLLVLSSNLTEYVFRRIYVDAFCCFFVLITLLVLFELMAELRRLAQRRGRIVFLSAMEGVALATALSTKFINMYLGAVVAAVYLVSLLSRAIGARRGGFSVPPIRLLVASGVIVAVSAAIFFVAINPLFYREPLTHLSQMLHHRLITMQAQARVQSPVISSHFFPRWALIVDKGVFIRLADHVPAKVLMSVPFLVGLGRLVREAAKDLAMGRSAGASMITCCWTFVTFAVNGTMIHVDWGRYFIPFNMCSAVVIAVGVQVIYDFLMAKLPAQMGNFGRHEPDL